MSRKSGRSTMSWTNEKSDSGTNKVAGEVQLRKYGKFLEDYALKIKNIETTLHHTISDSWDMSLDPLTLQSSPFEHSTLVQLIDTDNKILNKVLIALSACCAEIRLLENEAKLKYYNAILFYAEGGGEKDAAVNISRMLSTFQGLACFVTHCQRVLHVVLQQLSAINNAPKSNTTLISALDVHFQAVIHHIGDLLLILVTLDELIHNQTTLQDHWNLFKRTLKSTRGDLVNNESHKAKYHSLERLINDLEIRILSGNIVRQSLEQLLDSRKGPLPSPGLAEQIARYIRSYVTELDAKLDPQIPWTRLCVLFVLMSSVCGNTDKKLFKLIWEHHKKIAAVTLVGHVMWYPEDFLLKHLPHLSQMLDKKLKYYMNANRQYYLNQKCQTLPKEAQSHYFQVCSWLVQMDTCMKQDSTHLKMEHLQLRCSLFLQGLEHAITISGFVKTVTNLHLSLAKPMTKTTVLALCRLVELLKCIEYMYHTQAMAIAESLNHVIQHLTYQALGIIANAKKNVAADKKYSAAQLDVLSSLLLVERALHGPGTKERRLIAQLALATASQMKTFREEESLHLRILLSKLDAICELQSRLQSVCDCSFIYWHRVILHAYFAHLYETRNDLHRVTYMFAALRDCVRAMRKTRHAKTTQILVDAFRKETFNSFQSQILLPLCHEIETDLRLHVHSHLQLDERNPLRGEINNCAPLLQTQPLRFFDQYIYVKAFVESYLNQTFYNLTTVALHDWKTYGEMRCLAKQKYDLNTVEDNLPSQTLEQGLDVLEIMRNIHVFVSKYLYNLNNQIFIEDSSNNKHLNTINIRHIANSIRTHGTGIMNTTVNFTYQFLKKKFFILSQFLYDEQIKSRLIKDLRYFRENKTQNDQKYSYERADKFNRGIRKLGLSPEKLTYLDQFRILISHIGNAMGYIRMIRSGGIHYCSNAICFIPDLEDIVSFEELSQEQNLSESCIKSAKELDQVIGTLTRNFDEGTEYFKLLVDVFAPVCKDPKNVHLRNFHAIVPPLTINFVEHSITSKDKMTKKNKVGAAFTDDGFAMGVAYILKLLDLNSEFDSLHWFQSVRDKYKKEKADLLEQKTHASKDDEKLQQTMTLTARRLDMYQQEFELLYYSLSSARIFFQKNTTQQDVKDKEKDVKI